MSHRRSVWLLALMSAAVLLAAAATLRRADPAVAASTSTAASATFPSRLSETGLYGSDGRIDAVNRPFVPQYPLWTDGAQKHRWVRLPDNSHIDVSDPDGWRLPPGTTFWKEFAWQGRPVETRMIRILDDGSAAYASYAWNDEGTDAVLAPKHGIARSYEIAKGKWHAIPATSDCRNCHESGPSRILGFSAIQLSDDRDPLAPHAEPVTQSAVTLRTLMHEDRLRPSQPRMATQRPRIRARDSIERAALGYLSTNCGTCHNARGPLARLGFSLRHDFPGASGAHEPAIQSTIGHAGRFALDGHRDGARLIEPGAPELSAVVHRMQSRRASTQMPPLGTVIVDSVGAALVSRWIARMR